MANILLIDDDTVLLKLYSTRLKADHHQVATATNGEEGLALVSQTTPDIIVLDLLMPKINGFNFIDQLRRDAPLSTIPIIVFSSVANQEQIDRLKSLGINTILNKIDTTPTQLVTIINQHLTSSPQPQTQA